MLFTLKLKQWCSKEGQGGAAAPPARGCMGMSGLKRRKKGGKETILMDVIFVGGRMVSCCCDVM